MREKLKALKFMFATWAMGLLVVSYIVQHQEINSKLKANNLSTSIQKHTCTVYVQENKSKKE